MLSARSYRSVWKRTCYQILLTPQAQVTMPLDIDTYFKNEMDDRTVQENFNFELIKQILPKVSLFTEEECKRLDKAQSTFRTHLKNFLKQITKGDGKTGVDLSWKSSQIEGNTYSLLETERLLKKDRKLVRQGKKYHAAQSQGCA